MIDCHEITSATQPSDSNAAARAPMLAQTLSRLYVPLHITAPTKTPKIEGGSAGSQDYLTSSRSIPPIIQYSSKPGGSCDRNNCSMSHIGISVNTRSTKWDVWQHLVPFVRACTLQHRLSILKNITYHHCNAENKELKLYTIAADYDVFGTIVLKLHHKQFLNVTLVRCSRNVPNNRGNLQ